jgi:hypothetical protein
MWLDYCDEHNDPLSAPNRLDRDDYVAKYNDWLLEQYRKRSAPPISKDDAERGSW